MQNNIAKHKAQSITGLISKTLDIGISLMNWYI